MWGARPCALTGFDKMIPQEMQEELQRKIAEAEHPREQAIDIMYALQRHYGYLSDEAVQEAAGLLGMSPLELEEIATFYDFIYREAVGRYVIHVCDSTVCWMQGHQSIMDHLCRKLNIRVGETTPDGLFTVLPTCCLGYCDFAPAMLVNGKAYGPLTPQRIDEILKELREKEPSPKIVK
jgi:NADH-quinone oxidoreductase subunit E